MGKQRAPGTRLTSRLPLIPGDGRETWGRQEGPGTISPGRAEKGPTRTGVAPQGWVGGSALLGGEGLASGAPRLSSVGRTQFPARRRVIVDPRSEPAPATARVY